jgi:hypothetical protein
MNHSLSLCKVFLLAFIGLFLGGCLIEFDGDDDSPTLVRGSGPTESEDRTVDEATVVVMALPGALFVRQDAEASLTIEAQANLLPYIKAGVENGVLYIETDKDVQLQPTSPIVAHLTVPSLEALTFAGTGSAEIDSLQTTRLRVTLAGSGGITLSDLTALRLEIVLAGSGVFAASGIVDEQAILLAGEGDIEAADLASREATIEITGSGSATLRVSDQLTASIIGSGSVFFIGEPEVTSTIVGSGTVQAITN